MKNNKLRNFYILWSTQSLSHLGSAMTSFALVLWLYEETGSALQTSLLSICSYAPYVLMSMLGGALSDRWDKKKTMLVCDTIAAGTTLVVLALIKTQSLLPVHLYLINIISGLMNTIQQPANDVTMTLIVDKENYQKTSGLRSFSNSLVTILNPMIATGVFAFGGMELVILIDLSTFVVAFMALLLFVKIPNIAEKVGEKSESILAATKMGLQYLKKTPLIFDLMLFLAGVNLVAAAFDVVLPAYILPRANGGETVLGVVTSFAGIATLAGSLLVTVLPKPKNRIQVIYTTMLLSLSVENFILAFANEPYLWCIAQVIAWIVVPIMSANMDMIFRSTIPVELQGRVYSCRNTFQFFTIPIGQLLGGFLVDEVCEPVIANAKRGSLLLQVFGSEKGSGAAMMMFILGVGGTAICLLFRNRLRRHHYTD